MCDTIYCSECPYFKNLITEEKGFCIKKQIYTSPDYPYCQIPLQEWYEKDNDI